MLKTFFMKRNIIPLLWRKFFLKIAHRKDYIYNYCNDSYGFHRHCCEWYIHKLIKNNTDMDFDNEIINTFDNNVNHRVFME